MNTFLSFFCGLIFAIGLGLSGMTDPAKVLGFLEIGANWDPALAFVMVGAIAVHGTAYFLFRKKEAPVFASTFERPATQKINAPLVVGALTFGAGWGLGLGGPAMGREVAARVQVSERRCLQRW